MIHTSAATAAILLAQELDARRLVLTAQAASPLARLNDCIFVGQNQVKPVSGEYSPDANYLQAVSTNFGGHLKGEDVCHNRELDSLATSVGKHVQRHLRFAKSVVNPLIVSLAQEVRKDVESIDVDPYSSTQVVCYDLPAPVIDPSLQEEIFKFKKGVNLPELKHISLPEMSAGELLELMATGQFGLDDEIKTWYATKGDAFLSTVWVSCFTDKPSDWDFQRLKMGPDGLHACLAVFLLCNKLIDNPPEGVNMSMGQYNSSILDLKTQAAIRLGYAIDEYAAFVSTGLLIKTYTPEKIEVIGDVYRPWLETGGNNAMVLAATLMPTPIIHLHQIQERKEELSRRWERHVAMLKTTLNNKRFVMQKTILKSRARQLVIENFKECYANVRENIEVDVTLPEFMEFERRLNELLYNLHDHEFNNLYDLSMRVVCECVFYYTDAGKILKGIENACEKNPKLPVSEAAFLSLIEYVTDFVVDQIQVTSV